MKKKFIFFLLCVILTNLCLAQSKGQKQTVENSPKIAATKIEKLSRENKFLKKHFGLELPVSSVIGLKLKTTQSKTTYLFITMSANDAVSFKKYLYDTRFYVEDADCVDTKEIPCVKIGAVFSPNDNPSDVIDVWRKENGAGSDIIAHWHDTGRGKIKSFASMFFDSKKGYLLLWYKT